MVLPIGQWLPPIGVILKNTRRFAGDDSRRKLLKQTQTAEVVVLHPKDFRVREAWILFKLNDSPFRLAEGSFNCIALMDAGSTFIICQTFVPDSASGISEDEAEDLLMEGAEKAGELPTTLFVAAGQLEPQVLAVATRLGMDASIVSETELSPIIGSAQQLFRAR